MAGGGKNFLKFREWVLKKLSIERASKKFFPKIFAAAVAYALSFYTITNYFCTSRVGAEKLSQPCRLGREIEKSFDSAPQWS